MKLFILPFLLLISQTVNAGFLSGYVVGSSFSESNKTVENKQELQYIMPEKEGNAVIVCPKFEKSEGFCEIDYIERILFTEEGKKETSSIFVKKSGNEERHHKSFTKKCESIPSEFVGVEYRVVKKEDLMNNNYKLSCFSTVVALRYDYYAVEAGYKEVKRLGVLLTPKVTYLTIEVSK